MRFMRLLRMAGTAASCAAVMFTMSVGQNVAAAGGVAYGAVSGYERAVSKGPVPGTVIKNKKNVYVVRVRGKEVILAGTGRSPYVTIPQTVKLKNITYKVTQIGAGDPVIKENVRWVTGGKSVKSISRNAFRVKSNVNIVLEGKIKKQKIGKNAFSGLKKKSVVRILNSRKGVKKKIKKQNPKIRVNAN